MPDPPSTLASPGAERLAYRHCPGRVPTVVFLGGYASDMTGSKALRLEQWCRARGQACLRFDYSGHGESSGRFVDGSIGAWTDDALRVIGAVTAGPLLLVGSSMGGWIMLLVALACKARVVGLVGVAAAPDFTEDLMWNELTAEQRATLQREGELYLPSDYVEDPYPVTLRLIDEGRQHLLLDRPIALHCPVRLLHGLADPDVPWATAVRLSERLESDDVRLILVKGGGHRLSEEPHLALLTATVDELLG